MKDAPRFPLVLAFAAIYLIWGSTYLAIRFAVETIPPLMMMGARCLGAGAVLYLWTRARGTDRPEPRHWGGALVVGGFFFLGCHGLLSWAEQRVPSGTAALLLASVPLWTILLQWAIPAGRKPPGRALAGAFLGLAGMVLLFGPGDLPSAAGIDQIGSLAILIGGLSWAVGSIISRRISLPASSLLTTALQLLTGAALLLSASVLTGELAAFDPRAVSFRSGASLLYMVVFGSIITFSAYTWLLRTTSPAQVSTCTFVNPLIAMLLAWGIGDETFSPTTAGSALIVIGAVILIVIPRFRFSLFRMEAKHDCAHLVRRHVP